MNSAVTAQGSQASDAGGQRILLIDDDLVIVKGLTFKLKSWGYQVFSVTEGSAAFNAVNEHRPHLILLDVNFRPESLHGGVDWNGFRILEWMRRGGLMASVPVIVITAGEAAEYRERALRAGAADFFTKPLDPDALHDSIRKALAAEPGRVSPRARASL